LIQDSVASWPNVRPHKSTGSSKKMSGQTNQRLFPERAEKGPNFATALLPLPFPYE